MKVVFEIPYTRPEEVEVEFPIYGEHDVSGEMNRSIIYYRVDEKMQRTEVHVTEHYGFQGGTEYEIKFDPHHRFDPRSLDYELGRNEFKSTQEEFDAVLAEAFAAIVGKEQPCEGSAT